MSAWTACGPDRLVWPDYLGNAMFCTLGNIAVQPAAGLLFVDWETGSTLQLSGTARIDWDQAHAAAVPGAERLVEFTVTEVVETLGASPLRWDEPMYSRFNPPVAPPGSGVSRCGPGSRHAATAPARANRR